jgi:hypothetical protein
LVYQNGLCYYTCLSNYVDNGLGGCVQKNSVNCVTGKFLLDGNCVNTCPATYYANSVSGKCKLCPVNCNQCSSSSFCTVCALPYTANSQGLCVIKTNTCSNGQY